MSVWIGKSKICLKTYFLRKESCKKMEILFFSIKSTLFVHFDRIMGLFWISVRRLPSVPTSKLRYPPDSGSMVLRLLVLVCRSTNEFLYVHPMEIFDNICIFFNLHYLLLLNSIISRWNRRTETYLCYPHRCTETRLNLSEMHNTRDSDHLQHPIPVIRCLKVVFLDIWSPGICPRTPTKLSKKQNSNQQIRNYGLISYNY